MTELWKNAWRSIFRRPARSGLTVLSIAIGIFAVMLIGSMGEMGQAAVTEELNSLGMQSLTLRCRKDSPVRLTPSAVRQAERQPEVAKAAPFVVEYTAVSTAEQAQKAVLWGVDARISGLIAMQMQYGRELNRQDVAAAARVCILEESAARQLFGRENAVGRRVQAVLGGRELELEVVGIASAGGSLFQSMMGNAVPLFVYLPYTTHQLCTGRQDFDRIAVQFQNGIDPGAAGRRLRTEMNRWFGAENAVEVDNLSEYAAAFSGILRLVTAILSGIAGISLLVAGLSVMTAMLSAVGERTREIGIKKSLGASSAVITAEFLLEAGALSLAGSGAGILGGILAGKLVSLLTGLPYRISPELVGICLLSALVTGLIFSAYPAKRAAALRPVEALR